MLLSTLIGKKIYENGKERGVCDGVLLSSKNREIKYLSCRILSSHGHTVCLSFSQIDYVTDVVRVKRFYPRPDSGCEKLILGLPVYDEKGGFLGVATDAVVERNSLTYLLLNNKKRVPAYEISSFKDAVILKKAPPYPLSRRIPAYAVPLLEENLQKEKFASKRALLSAAKKGNLIKFTLSLPPFSLPSNGVLRGEF